jgi:hypothetical protein
MAEEQEVAPIEKNCLKWGKKHQIKKLMQKYLGAQSFRKRGGL